VKPLCSGRRTSNNFVLTRARSVRAKALPGIDSRVMLDNKKYECIIVNEVLCYVLNRIDTLPNEELVNIVSSVYDDAEINSASIILKDSVNRYLSSGSRRRLPKRIGEDKKMKSRRYLHGDA